MTDLRQFFLKIREAAKDGQGGSASYAHDRLVLIREMAEKAINKIDEAAR